MSEAYHQVATAAGVIHSSSFMGKWFTPEIGLILGSGLGQYAPQALEQPKSVPYSSIPNFPKPTAPGHAEGKMWWGKIGDKNVVIMQGRVHGYEGYGPDQIVFPARLMVALGAKTIILTNAVGAINKKYEPGDLVVIKDHISLFYPFNPLIGPNEEKYGPRFPSMSETYDKGLRSHALGCLEKLNLPYRTGVYVAVAGPQYETPAEIRLLNELGADIVGMSVVPETIAVAHMGAKVLAISCVTNMAAGINPNKLSHKEVVETAGKNSEKFSKLMTKIISTLPKQDG